MDRVRRAAGVLIEFLLEHTPFEKMPDADIIFVFGHYDERVAQQAAWLWHMAKAPYIVIAGKGGNRILSGYDTEADRYASSIIRRGVLSEAILLEKKSANLLENTQWGKVVWQNMGINAKSVIVCAIPTLLRRSCAALRKQCPEGTIHGSAFKLPLDEWTTWERMMQLVDEIERMERYAEMGDIEAIEIPSHVKYAATTLRLYCIA